MIAEDPEIRRTMSEVNLRTIRDFDVSVVYDEIKQIYNELLPYHK